MQWPNVPIVFCETRVLAQEWTYRFLGAAAASAAEERSAAQVVMSFPTGERLPPREPTTAEVRKWAVDHGVRVSDRGTLKPQVWAAYLTAAAGDSPLSPGEHG